jgi:alginate O-acetyltransferase complex protein AlgI
MIFTTPSFLVFALCTIFLLRMTRPWRVFPLVASILNVGFVWGFFGAMAVGSLLATAALGYVLFLAARRYGRSVALLAVALLVLLFFVVKRYPFVPDMPLLEWLPAAVGLSYLIFRMLHLIIDAGDGRMQKLGPFDFLAYALFFPTLLSGPIQLYDEFAANLLEEPARMRDVTRVALGYLKVCVLSPWLLGLQGFVLDKTEHATTRALHGAALLHIPPSALSETVFLAGWTVAGMVWFIYLYHNFSGYMDIVIGWARLSGIRLPENFNRPFTADSYLEYWNRWHMTLSQWFRAYLFGPLYKFLLQKLPAPDMLLRSLALFFTFLLIGIWHGRTWPYLVYGALLGIAAAVNSLYRDLLAARIGRPRMRRLNADRLYQMACFGLTFTFLSVAITPLWMTDQQYAAYLSAFISPGIMALPVLWFGAGVAIAVLRVGEARLVLPLVRFCQRLSERIGETSAQAMLVAVQVNFVLLVMFADFRQLPSFVYQAF